MLWVYRRHFVTKDANFSYTFDADTPDYTKWVILKGLFGNGMIAFVLAYSF